jgi:hypothetical protein
MHWTKIKTIIVSIIPNTASSLSISHSAGNAVTEQYAEETVEQFDQSLASRSIDRRLVMRLNRKTCLASQILSAH